MKTFVILGMHRSATSLVAKGINTIVHLGKDEEMLPPQQDNPEGFYENMKFMDLNNRILSKAGGSWLEPPSEENILALKDEFKSEIIDLINEHSQYNLWGWKDPRTSLTIRLFHDYLTNPHYIACYRNPVDVAHSLQRRKNPPMSMQKAIKVTMEYNMRIIKFLIDKHLKINENETR